MAPFVPDNTELEAFARYMGMKGLDADLFYETYYNLDADEYEEELLEEEELVSID